MIEKVKKILTAILAVIIVISIVYAAINLVINAFKEPELLTKDDLRIHMVSTNLVKDYGTYYYMKNCFDNMIEAVKRGKMDELYGIYMEDYKEQFTKDEIYARLEEFGVNSNEIKLKEVYSTPDMYILKYTINDAEETVLIALNSKATDYTFAFAK